MLTGNCESAPKEICLSMKSSGLSCVLFNQSECLNPDFAENNSSLNNMNMIEEAACPTPPPSKWNLPVKFSFLKALDFDFLHV